MKTVEIKFRKTFIFGIISSILWIFCIIGSSYSLIEYGNENSSIWVVIVFSFFFILSLFMVLYSRKIIFNEKGVFLFTYFGKYHLNWEEIQYIETCSGNMIIGNRNKRISLPSLEHWGKNDLNIFIENVEPIL